MPPNWLSSYFFQWYFFYLVLTYTYYSHLNTLIIWITISQSQHIFHAQLINMLYSRTYKTGLSVNTVRWDNTHKYPHFSFLTTTKYPPQLKNMSIRFLWTESKLLWINQCSTNSLIQIRPQKHTIIQQNTVVIKRKRSCPIS